MRDTRRLLLPFVARWTWPLTLELTSLEYRLLPSWATFTPIVVFLPFSELHLYNRVSYSVTYNSPRGTDGRTDGRTDRQTCRQDAYKTQARRRRGSRRCKLSSLARTISIRHKPCCGKTVCPRTDGHSHRRCLTIRVAYSLQRREPVFRNTRFTVLCGWLYLSATTHKFAAKYRTSSVIAVVVSTQWGIKTLNFSCHNLYNTWQILMDIDMQCFA